MGGGRVDFEFRSRCPQIKGMIITGKAKFTLEVGLDFWVCRISFASLEIGIEVGIDWFKIEIKCWWYHSDGWRRRRRWWSRRRRRWRQCNYRKDCDIYVKGWVQPQLPLSESNLNSFTGSRTKFYKWIKLYAWAWKWWEA